jgi:hypothetical protein
VSGKNARRPKTIPLSAGSTLEHIEISGDLDEHTVEAIRLEINQLAKRYGVKIKEVRPETPRDRSSG